MTAMPDSAINTPATSQRVGRTPSMAHSQAMSGVRGCIELQPTNREGGMAGARGRGGPVAALMVACMLTAGCTSFGPSMLGPDRLQYNEVVKTSAEKELMLNIVRLRYTDTPSSLAVSSIAAQFECTRSAGLLPFFTAAGADVNRSFTMVLP